MQNETSVYTDGTGRPKRDVAARTAIGECNDCGGNANSTLDGEHIWKCSEIVPIAAVTNARERLEKAMTLLNSDEEPDYSLELQLQHAHANLGGTKEDLYQYVDTGTE